MKATDSMDILCSGESGTSTPELKACMGMEKSFIAVKETS